MKFLAVLLITLCAFVAAEDEWTPPTEEEYKQNNFDCIKESGLTEDQVADLEPGQKELQELSLCNAKKAGVFTEENGFNTDRILKQYASFDLEMDKVREIVAKCVDSNEQKSTPAAWVGRVHMCLKANGIDEMFKEAKRRSWKKEQNNLDKEQ